MFAVGDLVRRGVENGHHHVSKDIFANVPAWGLVILGLTFVFFMFLIASVEYTFARLIPTLMMVESPEAVLFEPLSSEDPDALRKDQRPEPELLLVQQKPITSTFRSTIRHLRSKAGRLSRFRGYWFYILYTFSIQTLASTISVFNFIPNCVAPVIAGVVLSQLQMLWTHVVISEPTQQRWFKRADFSMASWKQLAVPTAVLAVAEQMTILLPAYLAMAYGLNPAMTPEDFAKHSNAEMQIMVLKGLSVGALAIAVSVLAVIPANVALTRVQASLLSDSEETIVPFDRSFGGKVVPKILGGSGAIGAIDAWKTFDWNSRIRLIKAYFKASVMQLTVSLLMVAVIFCELNSITGGNIQKVVPDQGATNEVRILPINI